MAEGLYCYQCEQAYPIALHPPRCNEAGERVCPHCASDFVELRQDEEPDSQLLRGLRTQLGLPQLDDPRGPAAAGPTTQHHSFMTPAGTRVAVSLTTTSFTAEQNAMEGSNVIVAALTNAFGGPNPMLINLGNLLGGGNGSISDFAPGELGLEQILQRLMDQYQPQATPASPDAVAALPRLKVATNSPALGSESASAEPAAACKIGETCTVCHDDFQEGMEVIQLPCKHCFHQDCLLPWLQSHNTCPVCRHTLPTDPTAQQEMNARDSEELHHPAVEAALSGIGQGHAQRTRRWTFDSSNSNPSARHQNANQQPAESVTRPSITHQMQNFEHQVRQAVDSAVLGDETDLHRSLEDFVRSMRPANNVSDTSAGPHSQPDSTRPVPPAQAADETMQLSDGVQAEATAQSISPARSLPQPIVAAAHSRPNIDNDSHPAGSSIDDIDIDLPLIQDEYASSEDALEGTSGGDEEMPSLLHDELSSSSSDLAAQDGGRPEDINEATALPGQPSSQAPANSPTAAAHASDVQDDLSPPLSSASSVTARNLLDPAQQLCSNHLPNKRLKRETDNTATASQPASVSQFSSDTARHSDQNGLADSSDSVIQAYRPHHGPISWARRGAGALGSWVLGMAGLR